MKSICFFIYDLKIGGAEKVIIYLANYFDNCGFDVTLLTVSDNNDLQEIINPTIEIISLNQKSIKYSVIPLIKFMSNNQLDYFIANVWPLTFLSAILRLCMKKTKLVFIEHCILSEEFKKSNLIFKILQNMSIRFGYKLANHIIAVSFGVKKDLIKKGVTTKKISVIYNPLVDQLSSNSLNNTEIDDWSSSKSIKLISVGELKESKNFKNLILSIDYYYQNIDKNIQLLIVGDGPEKLNLISLIKKKKLEGVIKLSGWVNNPIPLIEISDLFVLSSNFEGFGMVITEALSTGTNVVSTDCDSGPREILENGKFGYLCKLNDPEDLANSIKLALQKPMNKEDLIKKSEEYSIKKIGSEYRELIESL